MGVARDLGRTFRARGFPVAPVVTSYRDPAESLSNPFWKAISEDPDMRRSGASRHNMAGSPGTQIIPELLDSRDVIVDRKKRYDCFHGTDLDFVLQRKLSARTLVLTGVNTNSCVLCTAFEANARDYGVVVAADCVATIDGEEMHSFALRNMAITVAWVLRNDEILASLDAGDRAP